MVPIVSEEGGLVGVDERVVAVEKGRGDFAVEEQKVVVTEEEQVAAQGPTAGAAEQEDIVVGEGQGEVEQVDSLAVAAAAVDA